jgi:chemotaxis protein methyltransferase CheR
MPIPVSRTIKYRPANVFCLEGQGKHKQTLLIEHRLRSKVRFEQINLNARLRPIGSFDFIFLRNVLIYFNEATRRNVIARMVSVLERGGWLFIGHSETLNGITHEVDGVAPAIYRKR